MTILEDYKFYDFLVCEDCANCTFLCEEDEADKELEGMKYCVQYDKYVSPHSDACENFES